MFRLSDVFIRLFVSDCILSTFDPHVYTTQCKYTLLSSWQALYRLISMHKKLLLNIQVINVSTSITHIAKSMIMYIRRLSLVVVSSSFSCM